MRQLHRRLILAFGLLLCLAAAPAHGQDAVGSRIGSIISRPEYRQARWGILVVDAETGRPVYQYHPDEYFVPGSTAKLFFGAAALGALGPDFRFQTPVYARGSLADGRLQGDLILVAQGDPTLGGRNDGQGRMAFKDDDHTYANSISSQSELTDTDPLTGLRSLARQVAAAGIRLVDGDVLIDDRLFAKSRGTGSGPELLTPIMVNDNVVDVVVTPAPRPGERARVRMRPESAFLEMDAQVLTATEAEKTYVEIRAAGPHRFTVRGRIAHGARPLVRFFPVEDPTAFARALFIEALQQAGVSVLAYPTQTPRTTLPDRRTYDTLPRVAVFVSPPFSELMKVTLKASSNLYANTLPLLLAAHQGQTTVAEGMQLLRRSLTQLGVPTDGIVLHSAAGGRDNSLTPRSLVDLFQQFSRRPEYAVFRECLPVLGVDGTLASDVPPDDPVRGKVRAKTGTSYYLDPATRRPVLETKALAGTMTTAGGRTMFFALFVNNVPLPPGVTPSREGRVLAHLCEVLYQEL